MQRTAIIPLPSKNEQREEEEGKKRKRIGGSEGDGRAKTGRGELGAAHRLWGAVMRLSRFGQQHSCSLL